MFLNEINASLGLGGNVAMNDCEPGAMQMSRCVSARSMCVAVGSRWQMAGARCRHVVMLMRYGFCALLMVVSCAPAVAGGLRLEYALQNLGSVAMLSYRRAERSVHPFQYKAEKPESNTSAKAEGVVTDRLSSLSANAASVMADKDKDVQSGIQGVAEKVAAAEQAPVVATMPVAVKGGAGPVLVQQKSSNANRSVRAAMPATPSATAMSDRSVSSSAPNETPVAMTGSGSAGCEWHLTSERGMVSDAIESWARRAGWQFYWELNVDFPVEFAATFCGSFERAVEAVLVSFAETNHPVRGLFYGGNRVLRLVSGAR